MNIITTMRERLDHLSVCAELDVEASLLPASAMTLSDESLLASLEDVAAIANDAARVQAVLVGIAAQRSRREDGHSGLAAVRGHATPASLIQSITGGTKADAARQLRVGAALLEETTSTGETGAGGPAAEGAGVAGGSDASSTAPPTTAWDHALGCALLDGRLTSPQHDAIRGGLGSPPIDADTETTSDAVREAWSLAAESLIEEAEGMPVEVLAKRARIMRDLLDPLGAEERFAHRFENRSFRTWVDGVGQHHGRIVFDDEMALWITSLKEAALRPRRGGPRFVTEEEREAAAALIADPRTNEQLEYDLIMDVLRAGSLASAKDVFGARQPGIRIITVHDTATASDARERTPSPGHAEDGGDVLRAGVVERGLCDVGFIPMTVDSCGNPLDLGREQRLFSARQRLVLAARDGGCMWPGCTRPPVLCEAHHADHFAEDGGRTDVDRGLLLCRFHHMLLHNNGWRIRRIDDGPFTLYPPTGEGDPIVLQSKAAWKWAWDPPPPPDRAGWRTG